MSQHIKSPYNFVPLADFVHEPKWGKHVSQDIPFADGLSGVLECELTAHTPLHIGSDDKENGQPVMLNGEPIIPGSSLKGMIRNVLGIACFGRFNRFDDYRMSLRDLTPAGEEHYRSQMKNVKAGWLRRIDGEWRLDSCDYYRIEHAQLKQIKGRWLNRDQEKGSAAKDKYEIWGGSMDDYRIQASLEGGGMMNSNSGDGSKNVVPDHTGAIEGWLVFTGQPNPKKKKEFVFSGKPRDRRHIPTDVWRDFQMVHKDSDEWKHLTSDSPYWKSDGKIPVFFTTENRGGKEKIKAIGLSQMFRLPYKYAIGELVPDAVKTDPGPDHLDLTDLLFGDAFQRGEDPVCRGRVQFGLGRPVGEARPGSKENLILSTPRPSFYPAYVRQDGKAVQTYSSEGAQLSGWKRYPAANALREHPGVAENDKMNQHGNMDSPIRALPGGTRFRFKVRFHNLKPEELGALQWALTLGGNEQLRHRLGKGKPYGYGEVSIRCIEEQSSIRPNSGEAETVQKTLERGKQAFVQHMNNAVPGSKDWHSTEQVRALLAMADPAKSKADELCYYREPKDYQKAKGNNRDQPMKTLRKYY